VGAETGKASGRAPLRSAKQRTLISKVLHAEYTRLRPRDQDPVLEQNNQLAAVRTNPSQQVGPPPKHQARGEGGRGAGAETQRDIICNYISKVLSIARARRPRKGRKGERWIHKARRPCVCRARGFRRDKEPKKARLMYQAQ